MSSNKITSVSARTSSSSLTGVPSSSNTFASTIAASNCNLSPASAPDKLVLLKTMLSPSSVMMLSIELVVAGSKKKLWNSLSKDKDVETIT